MTHPSLELGGYVAIAAPNESFVKLLFSRGIHFRGRDAEASESQNLAAYFLLFAHVGLLVLEESTPSTGIMIQFCSMSMT
jgi:hypothetical protein